ncbi:MAG: DUF3592 domain-containing protein [Scytolyngbya sp. HA4215-MV1]|nr:DUF3592 domain-containing protein [Scytolyngbya sp. HA4215-MV1]
MEKKYSINIENDQVVSIEVDGVQYDTPDQIPNPDDRAKIEQLLSTSGQSSDFDSLLEDEVFNHDDDFPVRPADMERIAAETVQSVDRASKIILSVFFLVGVGMLTITALASLHIQRSIGKEKTAPGQVVELIARKDQKEGITYYYPVVKFTLPNGEPQRVDLSEGSHPAAYRVGDALTIAYDPEHPNHARSQSLSSTIGLWVLPAITGILGVSFLGVTLFAAWVIQSTATSESSSNQ